MLVFLVSIQASADQVAERLANRQLYVGEPSVSVGVWLPLAVIIWNGAQWTPYLGSERISEIEFYRTAGFDTTVERLERRRRADARTTVIGGAALATGAVVWTVNLFSGSGTNATAVPSFTVAAGGLVTFAVGLTRLLVGTVTPSAFAEEAANGYNKQLK